MPSPVVNLGGAPHDSDDIQDLWYALQELGFTQGYLVQADYDFVNAGTISAGGEVTGSVRSPGSEFVRGQAHSTGQFSLAVRWLDENDNIVREEGIISNQDADIWRNFSIECKAPFADIVIYDDSGTQQTVNMTVHTI